MFKKTLVAAALAGALVGSAFAANVTLYGVVDEGLVYQHTSEHPMNSTGSTTENTFTLNSGVDAGSRFGLKGTESLGNGYSVSFKLENGFNADDGQLGNVGRLFGREASLTVSGPFGALSAGRMGGLGSSAGTYDTVYAIGDAFDGGASLGLTMVASERYDNMLTYQTPKFAGVQATAQYSFKNDNKSDNAAEKDATEGKPESTRYAAFALTGEFGQFQGVAAYERTLYGSAQYGQADDKNVFYLGGNYDFGVAKVFALGQYFDGARKVGFNEWSLDGNVLGVDPSARNTTDGFKGYGLHLGTIVPAFGGDATFGLYYVHAKADDLTNATGTNAEDYKVNSYGVAARYEYPLSKRTLVYTGAEYYYEKGELTGNAVQASWYKQDPKASTVGIYLGLKHTF